MAYATGGDVGMAREPSGASRRFITWEEFLANQIAANRTNAVASILNGHAREGLAVL
jgi:hypothetical protein